MYEEGVIFFFFLFLIFLSDMAPEVINGSYDEKCDVYRFVNHP